MDSMNTTPTPTTYTGLRDTDAVIRVATLSFTDLPFNNRVNERLPTHVQEWELSEEEEMRKECIHPQEFNQNFFSERFTPITTAHPTLEILK